MENEKYITLTLPRNEMWKIRLALTSVIHDYESEIMDPETTEERREICEYSLEMWKSIKGKVIAQIKAQAEE